MTRNEYFDPGWRERARTRAPVLIALVVTMWIIATLALGPGSGLLTTAFIFFFSIISAATARRFGANLSLRVEKRSVQRIQRAAPWVQIAEIDQRRRELPSLQHAARESLRLAGYAIVLGTAVAALLLLVGARVQDSGQNEALSMLALSTSLILMPVAAIPWAASWVLRSSRIRIVDPETHATARIRENWVLRAIAPSALFSVLLALARRIETVSIMAQLATQFAMVVAGLLFLGVTAAVAVIILDVIGRERMYQRIEKAIEPRVVSQYGQREAHIAVETNVAKQSEVPPIER